MEQQDILASRVEAVVEHPKGALIIWYADPLEISTIGRLWNPGKLLARLFDLPCPVRWRKCWKGSYYDVHNLFCQEGEFRA